MKRATRIRWIWCLITSFFLLCSVVFLILLEVGNTYNTGLLRDWYFLRINVSNVVPASVPNFELLNSIARSLGLHDFYQVGLWNYCEGYKTPGVTGCSKPQTLYYFDPVAIIQSELLAGASSMFEIKATSDARLTARQLNYLLILPTSWISSRRPLCTCSLFSSPEHVSPSS